jgi:phage protein D
VILALAAIAVGAVVALLSANHDRTEVANSTSTRTNARAHGWPAGRSAWTVVLASAPSRGRAEAALALAERVPRHGLKLGVLHSSGYADLTPGDWVAFAGEFDGVEEAQAAVRRYHHQLATFQ